MGLGVRYLISSRVIKLLKIGPRRWGPRAVGSLGWDGLGECCGRCETLTILEEVQ